MTTTSPSGRLLLGGGSALAVAMLVANAGNYVLNLFLGRWLGPREFADVNLMVTLVLLVMALAATLQMVAAKVTATHPAGADTNAVLRRIERLATLSGLGLAALLALPATAWADYFHTGSPWPFVVLAVGMPAYLVQSVGRGRLQGTFRFGPLSVSFLVEMVVRLAVTIGLVAAGGGVTGATAGLTVSLLATWACVRLMAGSTRGPDSPALPAAMRQVRTLAGSVSVLLAAQIVLSNADILVAKRTLDPRSAGIYAAVALVGRAVFFLTRSVSTTVFPAAASREAAGQSSRSLLHGAVGIVLGLGLAATVGAAVIGGPVLATILGPEYSGLSGPLAGYALATTMFAVANVVATHRLSTGRQDEAWVLLAGGVVQVGALLVWHGSMSTLITVQLVSNAVITAAVLAAPRLTGRAVRPASPLVEGTGTS